MSLLAYPPFVSLFVILKTVYTYSMWIIYDAMYFPYYYIFIYILFSILLAKASLACRCVPWPW